MWWFDGWVASDACYIYIDSQEYKYTNIPASGTNYWGVPSKNDYYSDYSIVQPHTDSTLTIELKAGFGNVSPNIKSWGL
jgi:hypothetical protein